MLTNEETRERRKRRDETDLQWQMRVAQLDQAHRRADGPVVSPYTEAHGDYGDEFVTHVESNTLAWTKRNRITSPLKDMWERGVLSDEQYTSALEIAGVVEMIQRAVEVRGASLEARVDNSGGNRDLLFENMMRVRYERTYDAWRARLPMPRRMIIDMICTSRSLVATARVHGVNWRKARIWLIRSLDRWSDIRQRMFDIIDSDDVAAIHAKLGGGVLTGRDEDE